MGEAILASLIRAKRVKPQEVYVADAKAARRRALARRYGVHTRAGNAAVLQQACTVFLAVKPQDVNAVLAGVRDALTSRHVLVSIAAGKRLADLQAQAPRGRFVRVMPNLPVLAGQGMSVYCAGRGVSPAERRRVDRMLRCFGKAVELPEQEFDAVTALSGSGPAFFAFVLEAMIEGAVQLGLSRHAAAELAGQTMLGTACLLSEKGIDPGQLMADVASRGGTTEAGLKVLDGSPVSAILHKALSAAAQRSRELSSS